MEGVRSTSLNCPENTSEFGENFNREKLTTADNSRYRLIKDPSAMVAMDFVLPRKTTTSVF